MNQSQAQLRNAAARRLMARKRLREALDVLNEAIRLDPRWAESYDNRAAVFERMGMYPQAEADRRKVDELGGVQYAEPIAPPPPVEAEEKRKPARKPPPALPKYPIAPRPKGNGAAFRALGTVLITVGLFVAAGIGIYLALSTLTDAINDDNESVAAPGATGSGSATPAASDGAEITPTPTLPPEAPEEALQGDPLSFTRLQAAWQGKQFTVRANGTSDDVTGFRTTPVSVTLTRGGAEIGLAVLLYDSPDAMRAEWNVGESVSPRNGGTIPAGSPVWANLNAVVVVVVPDETLRADARDSFLGITA